VDKVEVSKAAKGGKNGKSAAVGLKGGGVKKQENKPSTSVIMKTLKASPAPISPALSTRIVAPLSTPPPPSSCSTGKFLEMEGNLEWLKGRFMEDKRAREDTVMEKERGTDRVTCMPVSNACSHLFTSPCLCVCL
jgi:hypothetical protein